jgi:hypothetical protein
MTVKKRQQEQDRWNRTSNVPDLGSRDRDVVLVRRGACWGNPKGGWEFGMGRDWGGSGRGRSVYGQPGAKVHRIASRQRRVSK